MENLLQLDCIDCGKRFIVVDDEIDGETLGCPHCGGDVPVPSYDEDTTGEDEGD